MIWDFSLCFLIFSFSFPSKNLSIPSKTSSNLQITFYFFSLFSQFFPTFLIFSSRFPQKSPPNPLIFPSFSDISIKNIKIFLEQYQRFTKKMKKNFLKNLVSIVKGSNFATPNQMILNARAGESLSREGR